MRCGISPHKNKAFAALHILLAVAMVAAMLAGTALAGLLEDAAAAYERGDYPTALRIRLELAEQSNPEAQVWLGLMYARGHGVPRDDAQAVQWYRRAAERDYAWGQTNLGYMYETGRGVVKDEAAAVKWYLKAAEQGFAMAQSNLGISYRNGRGVGKDDASAVAWFRKAAEQGYVRAQTDLGYMYETGQGVAKDEAEAAKWYLKAAERGQAIAQDNLGLAYLNGRGVARDDAAAVAWFRKAAEQGHARAQNNLGHMYENGFGVAKDLDEAAKWYRKAADQGSTLAVTNLTRIAKGNAALDTSNCSLVQIDQWPVRFARNGWLVVDGTVNGRKVGFMLDTGAMRTTIVRPAAAQLGLTIEPLRGGWTTGSTGESIGADISFVGEFRIAALTRRNWQMRVVGERDFGDGIGVILGEDFFQDVDVEFDLANRTIRFFQARNCKDASLAYWAAGRALEVEIEAINDPKRARIIVPVRVNGLPVAALLDTGAEFSILHRHTAGRLGVRPSTPGVIAAGAFSGIGKESSDLWIGPIERFEIGNAVIKETAIPFGDIGADYQMLLGLDFLSAHRLLVSHSQRKIYFTHNGGPVFKR